MSTVYLEDLQPDKEIFMDWNKEYENMQTVQVDNLEGDIPTDRTIYMIKNINPRENRLSTIVNFEKTLKDCLIRIPDVNVLL